ncbi:TNF receptor-associated factor 2-like [Ptychodera flava]|uniref:TNF receptor-associated factor 2-like n=1 Tax=Ptychodera flava TaxID=63121 RepID=UPI00396A80A8
MAGFSLDLLKTVEEKYICQHCQLILRDAVQTSCGHRYCKECFQGLIRDDDNECSACINEGCLDSLMNAEQMFPDRAISRELNEKTVRCINDGCDWTGLFKLYQEEHFDSCQYSVIACLHRNGCDKYIQRRNLTRHLGDECVMRMVRCPHCDAEMVYKEFQEHLDSCPKCQVSCTFCGEILNREQIQKHTDDEDGDCPRMPLPCDFRCVGCIEMVEKEKMDDHKKRHLGQHLVMLMETLIPFLTVLRTEKDNSLTEVADLKKSVQCQAEKISSLQSNLKEVRDWSEDIRVRQRRQEEKFKNSQDYGENIKVLERAIDELKHSFEAFGIKVSVNEGVTAVLRDEVEKLSGLIQSFFEHQREDGVHLKALERIIKAQDKIIAAKDVALAEQDIRIQALEMASYDGVLLWKITNFNRKRNDAVSRRATSIYSPCFHTSRHGYKMCARVYLNGDGMGLGNHVSLFFVIMKGPYDALLRWPFRQKVTFEWLDQSGGEHVVDAFRPDPNSSSFQRPVNDMNIASGCPLFLPLSRLDSPRNSYVKDDAAFIKISVDVSDLI